MKGGKPLFIFFIVLLLIVSSVNADFIYLTKSSSNALCPRESGLFIDNIKNTDNIQKEFKITLSGDATAWSTSLPNTFLLNAGESKEVYTYITPSQEAQPGNYLLSMDINVDNIFKSIRHTINVKDCYKTEVGTTVSKYSICPSQLQTYEVTIINKGEYSETYNLNIESSELKDFATLSETTVTLNKNQDKKIFVYVKAPEASADYKFNLIADNGRTKASYKLELEVLPCYNFKFNLEGVNNYNVCDRTATVVPFRLENLGSTTNDFDIKIDGPIWVRSENVKYHLMSQESKSINIAFAPDYAINGTFPVKVTAVPDKGNAKIQTSFTINVRKCHSVQLQLLDNQAKACKTITTQYDLKLKNTGEIQKIYKLKLEGPSWAKLDGDDTVVLKSNEERIVKISTLPLENVNSGNYEIKVNVVANDESSVITHDEQKLKIEVVDLKGCYQGILTSQYDNVAVYYDSNIAIPVSIKNAGFKKADFAFSIAGNASSFIRLNPSTLSLDSGKEEIIYLYVAPEAKTRLGSYDVTLVANLREGSLVGTKNFKIEITDTKDKATQISLDTTPKKAGLSMFTKTKNFISIHKLQLGVLIAVLILLIISFLLGWHKKLIDFFEDEELNKEVKQENKVKRKVKKNVEEHNKDIKDGVGE